MTVARKIIQPSPFQTISLKDGALWEVIYAPFTGDWAKVENTPWKRHLIALENICEGEYVNEFGPCPTVRGLIGVSSAIQPSALRTTRFAAKLINIEIIFDGAISERLERYKIFPNLKLIEGRIDINRTDLKDLSPLSNLFAGKTDISTLTITENDQLNDITILKKLTETSFLLIMDNNALKI